MTGPNGCGVICKESFMILVAGIGLLTDFYDFTVINLVKPILKEEYPVEDFDNSNTNSMLTASSLFGALCGQLILGALADRFGRRRLLLLSGALAFLGSLGSACSINYGTDGIYTLLILFRFVMGVGIGGEYPLSSSHTMEHAKDGDSGWRLALTYSMMGVGTLLSSLIVYLFQVAGANPELTWRFAFGFGAFLSLMNIYLRYNHVQDSAKFVSIQEEKTNKARGVSLETESYISTSAAIKKYWFPLVGTMGAWFLYDIIDYGLGLYSAEVVSLLDLGSTQVDTTKGVLIINLIGLPGFFASAFMIEKVGRKQTQLLGVSGMLICYLVLGLGYNSIKEYPYAFLVLYGAQLLFDNLGPGASTFVIPAEIFPTVSRATCHGMSAAAGKSGAVVGSYTFNKLMTAIGLENMFWFCLGVSLLLNLWTWVFIPFYGTKQLVHLEESQRNGEALTLLYKPCEYFEKYPVRDDLEVLQASAIPSKIEPYVQGPHTN